MKSSPNTTGSPARRATWLNLAQRVAVLATVGITLATMWWSVQRLRLAQRESARLTQQVSKLSTDIDLMQAQWTPEKAADLEVHYAAARDQLFLGSSAIESWRNDLFAAAVPLALDTEIRFAGTRMQTVDDEALTIMQAEIDIAPSTNTAGTRPPYHRLLDLAQRLTVHPQRLDFVGLQVSGRSNSVHHASATVELWAADPSPSSP